jgi:hypothetical protein
VRRRNRTLALQETKLTDDRFPVTELRRLPQPVFRAEDLQGRHPGPGGGISRQRTSTTTSGASGGDRGRRAHRNLYVVNGSEVGSEIRLQLQWLQG